jgi:hypothetical protein
VTWRCAQSSSFPSANSTGRQLQQQFGVVSGRFEAQIRASPLRLAGRKELARQPDAQLGIEWIDLGGVGEHLQRLVAFVLLLEQLRRFLQQLYAPKGVAKLLRRLYRGHFDSTSASGSDPRRRMHSAAARSRRVPGAAWPPA